jgi:hypothetical protein
MAGMVLLLTVMKGGVPLLVASSLGFLACVTAE